MTQCAECGVYICRTGRLENLPEHCPMHSEGATYEEAKQQYLNPDVRNIGLNSALTESALCLATNNSSGSDQL